MHTAYTEVPFPVVMAAMDDFIDEFVSRYSDRVVFLGRMWRVWRNGEWVIGNDAEVNTYLHKHLLDLERSDLPASPLNGVYNRRAVLHGMRDPEHRDLMISLLKIEPGLKASEFEASLRTGKANRSGGWRKYQKWVAQLPPPPGETKRVGEDPEVVEQALLDEYRELGIISFELEPEENYENLGMHVGKIVDAPTIRWNIGPLGNPTQ